MKRSRSRYTSLGAALCLAGAACSPTPQDQALPDEDASVHAEADGGAKRDSATADSATADSAAAVSADAGHLAWYRTCGDPVCRTDEPKDAGVDACDGGQELGKSCSVVDEQCDPGSSCGSKLRCTDSDPTLRPGGCPISRASYKLDIHYLNESDMHRYHHEVMGLGLAHYTYRNDPSAQQRLGFIIEDVEPSQFVDEARDRVDLYAYTSAVIAAVKVQEQRIQQLENEVRVLRARQAGKRSRQ
ncbi:MAG: putative secreted protein [Myxococcaceae bacterium]|nr:putative secreted protein [Myxococcaceae bacterium]